MAFNSLTVIMEKNMLESMLEDSIIQQQHSTTTLCWHRILQSFKPIQRKRKGWGQYAILEFTATMLYKKVRLLC